MPILNYTTEVAASKSVGEISALLVRNKVKHVGVEYDGFGIERSHRLKAGDSLAK